MGEAVDQGAKRVPTNRSPSERTAGWACKRCAPLVISACAPCAQVVLLLQGVPGMAPAARSLVRPDTDLPVMMWRARPDLSCEYASSAWLEFTGFSAEQALGDGWSRVVHGEDLARGPRHRRRAFHP